MKLAYCVACAILTIELSMCKVSVKYCSAVTDDQKWDHMIVCLGHYACATEGLYFFSSIVTSDEPCIYACGVGGEKTNNCYISLCPTESQHLR